MSARARKSYSRSIRLTRDKELLGLGGHPYRFPSFYGNRSEVSESRTQKPRKGDLRESKSKTFSKGAWPWTGYRR